MDQLPLLLQGVETAILLGIFFRLGTLTTKVNIHHEILLKKGAIHA